LIVSVLPNGEDVESGGERGLDCLIIADIAGRASVLLALAVLLSEPHDIDWVSLLRKTAFLVTPVAVYLLDQFSALLA
jgi:hypothetical protein